MNNQIYNFFPLTILKSKIDLDKSIKDLMIKKIFEMEKNSKNLFYKNENSSWTGDTQGYEFLHIISEFDDFFIEVKKKILEYLDIIEINHDLLDIYSKILGNNFQRQGKYSPTQTFTVPPFICLLLKKKS